MRGMLRFTLESIGISSDPDNKQLTKTSAPIFNPWVVREDYHPNIIFNPLFCIVASSPEVLYIFR